MEEFCLNAFQHRILKIDKTKVGKNDKIIILPLAYHLKEINTQFPDVFLLHKARLKCCLFLAQLGAHEASWEGGEEVRGGARKKQPGCAAMRVKL